MTTASSSVYALRRTPTGVAESANDPTRGDCEMTVSSATITSGGSSVTITADDAERMLGDLDPVRVEPVQLPLFDGQQVTQSVLKLAGSHELGTFDAKTAKLFELLRLRAPAVVTIEATDPHGEVHRLVLGANVTSRVHTHKPSTETRAEAVVATATLTVE